MIRYGTVAQMIAYLDREAIAKRRYKNSRKFFRAIKSKELRKFAKALKYEMIHDRTCNESNICEKVISRCKIGRRMYEINLKSFR